MSTLFENRKMLARSFALVMLGTAAVDNITAEELYWHMPQLGDFSIKAKSPEALCDWYVIDTYADEYFGPRTVIPGDNWFTKYCSMVFDGEPGYMTMQATGDGCPAKMIISEDLGGCVDLDHASENVCKSNRVGNPISVDTGIKFQREYDYVQTGRRYLANPLSFYRTYLSSSGLWKHNFSHRLTVFGQEAVIKTDTDTVISFKKVGSHFKSDNDSAGQLERALNHWTYTDQKHVKWVFNNQLKLSEISYRGSSLYVNRRDQTVFVTDSFGRTLVFEEDKHGQPVALKIEGLDVKYIYDTDNNLTDVKRAYLGAVTSKIYRYNSPHGSKLLTSIVDERGIEYVKWEYDGAGRAVKSQTAPNSITEITYDTHIQTSATNPLGSTTFIYAPDNLNRKPVTIITQNKKKTYSTSFNYNSAGQILKKTDNNGNQQLSIYDTKGNVVEFVRAAGTPQELKTLTQWSYETDLPTETIVGGIKTTRTFNYLGLVIQINVSDDTGQESMDD
ncbi:hypothetical protein [Pseudomonas coleopterorum]|uniref:hypothetical protein n=1 Tax=Pseudomonas coleopterorum TaxID=1605838 RepID=UPI00177D6FD9|nr:hypothetical protein [Pseudomonas coleopterorum]MBD8481358.1 hypothetical protein [Pseudomonas coleopterorum]